MRCGQGALLGAAILAACGPTEDAGPPPSPPVRPVVLTLPANGRDSAATLDSLAVFVSRVDRDTVRMILVRDQVDLGAGAKGTVSAWRADSVWQRLHLAAGGEGFVTSDTYWLTAGEPVAARLEIQRPAQPPIIERVWFRGGALYRWEDAQGRHLSPDAQSTKTEVEMLKSRVARLLEAIPRPDVPTPQP